MRADERRDRYIAFFEFEPSGTGVLDELERSLGISLPEGFRQIATFYSGGMLGGISHHAIAISGPATNVLEETLRLRKTIDLPASFLVLAEPSESLILMDTAASEGAPAVIWIDAVDVLPLSEPKMLRNPQHWPSYEDFFDFLLQSESEERAEG